MILKYNLLTIGTILSLLFTACVSNNEPAGSPNNSQVNENFFPNIRTTTALYSNPGEELILTGNVEADPNREIRFVPLISGVIDKIYFSLGDKVQKGQTLIDIRSTELSTLQSEMVSLEAEVKIAERELKTAKEMYADNMLSEKELLEAEGKLKQNSAALEKVKTDMSVFGLNKGNGTFSIKAPMSGYITTKNASPGSTVSADGDPLFSIVDLNTVWVTANVYPSDVLFVREGMQAQITTLVYPGLKFTGSIHAVSQVFDPEEKVLKARIVMKNENLKLKPGMAAVIKLKNESKDKLIAIPSDALIFDNDRYFVITQENPGNYHIKEVTIQGHHNKTTYIASGLTDGETIVTRNQLLIFSQLQEASSL